MKISNSKIDTYLQCRRKYELSYVHGLKPIKDAESLEIGRDYHKRVESILLGQPVEHNAMSKAFERFIDRTGWVVEEVEKEFTITLPNGHELTGVIDAIVRIGDKRYIVEHKTTSSAIDEKYLDRLKLDRQILIYCLATGLTDIIYTVCKKPTIRQTKNETTEEYNQRCFEWYDEDKIKSFTFTRMRQEIMENTKEIMGLSDEMETNRLYPRNPSACKIMGCPFTSICLNYDPECVVGFTKKDEQIQMNF